MQLPEMYIRLEVDGEKIKEHHMTGPYTRKQRDEVLRNLRNIGKNRDGNEVAIVFSPVEALGYMEFEESQPERRKRVLSQVKINPHHKYNSIERNEARIKFVKERLEMFDELYKIWAKPHVRRVFVGNDRRMVTLLKEAREAFEYQKTTSDLDIAEALFNCYRKHMAQVAFQKMVEEL